MNFSLEEREAYEDHLKWLRIEANTLKKAEAEAKGRSEEKKEMASGMLAARLDINLISNLTKLTFEEINKLKEESPI